MSKFLAVLLFPLTVCAVSIPYLSNSKQADTNITATTNITITSENSVLLRGEVNDDSVSKVQKEISVLVIKRGLRDYPIYLVLDTPGGSIDAGLNLIESLKTVNNLETITLFAASMGSAVVEAVPGRRNITDNGILMFHRARGGFEGQFEDGEAESRLEMAKKVVRKMEQVNADRMKLTLKEYKAKVVNELWVLGSESVAKNAADRIVTVTCSRELIEGKEIIQFSVMGMFSVDVEFSKCGLIKSSKALSPDKENLLKRYKEQMKWGTK